MHLQQCEYHDGQAGKWKKILQGQIDFIVHFTDSNEELETDEY